MALVTYQPFFAQVYGGGGYSSSTYQNGTSTSSGSGPATAGSPTAAGSLTNTGFDVLLAATLACAIVFAALVVRFWKRPKGAGSA